jgi:glycosyltransferase involved in cell wall biosynthesis
MTQPLVSVVIAVRNGEAFLAEALDSVAAQTWPAFEILVVDGHSTDRSREIARAYPAVRVLLQEGSGFAGAWNEGIRAGRGAYVAILDADDVWLPTKLARQVAALEAAPTCGYALAHTRHFLMEGAPMPPGFARVDLDKDHAAPFPSVLLARRSLFDDVGLFEERWSVTSDVEWFRRVYDRGIASVMLPEVLMRRRLHASNLSSVPPVPAAYKRELLSILKTSLDRRRQADGEKTP